jgi:condensation domain-containing protein/phosphopantetheine binding protein/AMP-binding enzyme
VTWWGCEELERRGRVSIGGAIGNTEVYVVEEGGEVAGIGVRGELQIGGVGVGRGYWRKPEQTAEKFVPDGISGRKGEVLYRTGDEVRRGKDGMLEYLGRKDGQVKVRGNRIELGEVESVLGGHEGVRQCAVAVRGEGGDKRLVGYVVKREGVETSRGEMRKYLRERLPEYMVPGVIVELEEMPVTANGKLDRRRLPEAEEVRGEEEREEARTVEEEIVVGIWEEVLKVEGIGVEENFFELGGHSLLATQVMSRVNRALGVEVGLRVIFEEPTVRGLAGVVERERRAGRAVEVPEIRRVSREGELPLSFAQQRLWFLDQLEPGSTSYNSPTAVKISGNLDEGALERALNEVVRRHEILRTTIGVEGGEAVQKIKEAGGLKLEVKDLSEKKWEEREGAAEREANEDAQRPFDLENGPLMRVKLVKMGEGEHVLIITMHHIVTDEWSMGVLVRELGLLYEAYTQGRASPLEELRIQFADYAVWQRRWLQGEPLEKLLCYWRKKLSGAPPVLKLATDRPRPTARSFRGEFESFTLPPELSASLKALSRQEECTLFMTLLAGFKALLTRYTQQEDIVVGTAIGNRNRAETEQLIGFFVNTLVMRTDLSGDPSFKQLMRRIRETALEAYAHQDMPFEKVVEMVAPDRESNYNPLFQIAFGVRNAQDHELKLPGLTFRPLELETKTGRFDLTIWMVDGPDELRANWIYDTELFEAATIGRMQGHYQTLLASIVREPEAHLSELEMLSEEEKTFLENSKKRRMETNIRSLRAARRKSIAQSEALLIKKESGSA